MFCMLWRRQSGVCFIPNSFRDCLLRAVNLGDDTDTTAAIAGGLAGLYYHYEAMPQEWVNAIRRKAWIKRLCLQEL